MSIRLNVHSNIYSENVEIMCPPKLMREFLRMLEKLPGIELAILESAVKAVLDSEPRPEVKP